ncbi:MAG: hypothetical protein M5R36_18340 [Deltaproteobacteria bacterium]|nr:hypothetical protein [Deltaproteobacteria bacterium]
MIKADKKRMRRYDVNGDGQIDEKEWEAARKDAENEALVESLGEKEPEKQEASLRIHRAEDSALPFVISASTEVSIKRGFGMQAVLFFLGALGMAGLGVYLFIMSVNLIGS